MAGEITTIPLIRTKLQRPPIVGDHVHRSQLLERLNQRLQRPLTLVIVRADNKRRARLNCISHFLDQIPYKKLTRDKVKFGTRSMKGKYDDQASIAQYSFIPEKY